MKNRLNTHGENIPKGARKADLVALLIKIETNLLKGKFDQNILLTFSIFLERKEAKTIADDPPARRTRRKK